MMRLAYFSPLNPQRSGISDYSEELLPFLAKRAKIDLFVDGFQPSSEEITRAFQIFDYRQHPEILQRLDDYDALICQMGNNHRYHRGIYEVACTKPAIIVLHDFALQNFFLERARELRDPKIYVDQLEGDATAKGEAEEALVRGSAPPQYHNPIGFPLNSRLAAQAEGIVVHSEWSRSRLASVAPGVPILKINLHVKPPDLEAQVPMTADRKAVSIASFGFITANKGLEIAIRALAALQSDYSFHYYLVGETNPYFDVLKLASLYGISDRVSVTGYVSLSEFNRRIAKTDIAINLREQTVGETSASLCRLMAAGVPTIVSNIGWFSELPDDCVIKIEHGPEADLLVCAFLRELIENRKLRERIGASARKLILTRHQAEQTAADYIDFITYLTHRRPNRMFIQSLAKDIASLSTVEPDELLIGGIRPALSDLL